MAASSSATLLLILQFHGVFLAFHQTWSTSSSLAVYKLVHCQFLLKIFAGVLVCQEHKSPQVRCQFRWRISPPPPPPCLVVPGWLQTTYQGLVLYLDNSVSFMGVSSVAPSELGNSGWLLGFSLSVHLPSHSLGLRWWTESNTPPREFLPLFVLGQFDLSPLGSLWVTNRLEKCCKCSVLPGSLDGPVPHLSRFLQLS